jgi:hypothetical protein
MSLLRPKLLLNGRFRGSLVVMATSVTGRLGWNLGPHKLYSSSSDVRMSLSACRYRLKAKMALSCSDLRSSDTQTARRGRSQVDVLMHRSLGISDFII